MSFRGNLAVVTAEHFVSYFVSVHFTCLITKGPLSLMLYFHGRCTAFVGLCSSVCFVTAVKCIFGAVAFLFSQVLDFHI